MNIFYQQQAFIFILYTMVKDMNTGGRGRKEKPWGIPALLDTKSLISWERLCKEKSPYCNEENLRN
jgi:hypothetical protein